MSTFLDGLFSDGAPASSAPGSSAPAPSRRHNVRSSSRPRGPPSESAGANSDIEGFPDDEVVGVRGTARRPRGPPGDIPKVVDAPGEKLVDEFENFLEKYMPLQLICVIQGLTKPQLYGGSNFIRRTCIECAR
jgi:DNA replication licensing factor MCM6